MQALRSAKRLQGFLPRWLGGVPHSSSAPIATAIEDSLGIAGATLIDAPCMPFMLASRTRTLTSAALAQASPSGEEMDELRNYFAATAAQATFEPSLEEPESRISLPDDLETIGRLNPELREAMEAHAATVAAAAGDATPRQALEALLADAAGGRAVRITKTALGRLRVDQLRTALTSFGADTRGNKPALVKRLLDAVASADAVADAADLASNIGVEGVVTRKAMARAERLRERAGVSPDEVGVSDAALRRSHDTAISDAAQFTRVFSSPHDVARLLVEARADDIAIIDVRGHCTFTDYMVLATGRSPQLVHMLAQAVLHEVKQRAKEVAPGVAPGIEGVEDPSAEWLVVDAGSLVVHVFAEGARREYDLEGLWGGRDNVTRVATPRDRRVHTLDTLRA